MRDGSSDLRQMATQWTEKDGRMVMNWNVGPRRRQVSLAHLLAPRPSRALDVPRARGLSPVTLALLVAIAVAIAAVVLALV